MKRPRGAMEELMRQVCDQIVTGVNSLHDGEFWTVARIANFIHEAYPGSGVKPSVGAVAENLRRWQEIGFAVINEKPLAFLDFTEEGKSLGLTVLKERAAEKRRAERAAVREALRIAKKEAQQEAQEAARVAEMNPPLPLEGLQPAAASPTGSIESLRITYTPTASSF